MPGDLRVDLQALFEHNGRNWARQVRDKQPRFFVRLATAEAVCHIALKRILATPGRVVS